MSVFRLKMLPAGDGDCLVLTWGEEGDLRHAVIDGGRAKAYDALKLELRAMAEKQESLELFVLTHIDADHIEGALRFVEDEDLPLAPKVVWYNGFDQMSQLQSFGEKQGDRYSEALAGLEWPLNKGFDRGIVSIETAPEHIEIAGLKIKLLSPDWKHLAAMRSRWAEWRTEEAARRERAKEASAEGVVAMGPTPMPRVLNVEELAEPGVIDREPPNGSSIAFIAEYAGRRMLLAGDAHPDLLETQLAALAEAEGGRYPIEIFKVSHHGSKKNTTRGLVERLDCRRFALSTNGNRHGHPNPEAIARLLKYGPRSLKRLYFNFRTRWTEPWQDQKLQEAYRYDCEWPPAPGFIELDALEDLPE
jgi:beta-lactamase superfamily II metal-dependent hydrolase